MYISLLVARKLLVSQVRWKKDSVAVWKILRERLLPSGISVSVSFAV